MIGTAVKELLPEKQEMLLVSAENVANVICLNSLSHVALVLSQVRYLKIPVSDKGDRSVDLIDLTDVVDEMFDLTSVDFEKSNEFTVVDVMKVNVPVTGESRDLEEALHLLVDAPFLPVVDGNQRFKGIITRKEILKAVDHMVRELEKYHLVLPESEEEMKVI